MLNSSKEKKCCYFQRSLKSQRINSQYLRREFHSCQPTLNLLLFLYLEDYLNGMEQIMIFFRKLIFIGLPHLRFSTGWGTKPSHRRLCCTFNHGTSWWVDLCLSDHWFNLTNGIDTEGGGGLGNNGVLREEVGVEVGVGRGVRRIPHPTRGSSGARTRRPNMHFS